MTRTGVSLFFLGHTTFAQLGFNFFFFEEKDRNDIINKSLWGATCIQKEALSITKRRQSIYKVP